MNFCLGTVQFGIDYGIQGNGKPKHEAVYDMLSYAIEHGIELFDTASAYGEAEDVLGGYVRLHPENAARMHFVSKLKADAFAGTDKKEWTKIAVGNARESLKQLGISSFNAYLFHNASFIFDEDAVLALNAVKEDGLAEQIGVSIYTPEEALKALDYSQIGAIQIPYNLFDRRLDKCAFFKKAKEKGVMVYARSSLLQGLLLMDPDNLPEKVAFARKYLLEFEIICKEFSVSKLNAAIAYVAQKPGIDYVVFGVDNQRQLEEYISLEHNSLPEEMTLELDRVFEDDPEKLVNPVLWK